jgi:hypothetical protein
MILKWMKRGWFLLISNTHFAYSDAFSEFFLIPRRTYKSIWKFHSVHEQKSGGTSQKYWLCETCKALTSSYFNGNLKIFSILVEWVQKPFTSSLALFYWNEFAIGCNGSPGEENILCHPFSVLLSIVFELLSRKTFKFSYGNSIFECFFNFLDKPRVKYPQNCSPQNASFSATKQKLFAFCLCVCAVI